MDTPLVIISIIILGIFLWYIYPLKFNTIENFDYDDMLTSNYHKKQMFSKRVILVIETFDTLGQLLTLLRNILQQNIKVNSIILISNKQEDLKKVKLIHNTCVLNNVGGLSVFLKESSNDTIIIFIFSEGFNAFKEPNFLKKYLSTDHKVDGIVKGETNLLQVDINKIY